MAGRLSPEQVAVAHMIAATARRNGQDPVAAVMHAWQTSGLKMPTEQAQTQAMHPLMPHLVQMRHSASLMPQKGGTGGKRPQMQGGQGSLDAIRRRLLQG